MAFLVTPPVQLMCHPSVEVGFHNHPYVIDLDEDLEFFRAILLSVIPQIAQAMVSKGRHFCGDLLKGP